MKELISVLLKYVILLFFPPLVFGMARNGDYVRSNPVFPAYQLAGEFAKTKNTVELQKAQITDQNVILCRNNGGVYNLVAKRCLSKAETACTNNKGKWVNNVCLKEENLKVKNPNEKTIPISAKCVETGKVWETHTISSGNGKGSGSAGCVESTYTMPQRIEKLLGENEELQNKLNSCIRDARLAVGNNFKGSGSTQ